MLGLNRRRGTEKVGGVLLGMQKPRLNPWTPQLDMMSHTCNPREKIIKLRSFLTKEHVLGQTGLQEMLSLIKTNKQANKQRSKVGWRGNSAVGSACSSYKRGPTSGAHNYLYLWFQGIQNPFLASVDSSIDMVHIHTPRHTHTHKIKRKMNK